jgi:hypothetical protein
MMGGAVLGAVALWLGSGLFGAASTPVVAPTAEARALREDAAGVEAPGRPAAAPGPPVAPTAVATDATSPRPRHSARQADVPACTGGVTLPKGKWRLRPRAPRSDTLVTPSRATPCGKYKLMSWNAGTKDWDERKNVVVREGRVLACSAKLHCAFAKR